MPPRPKRRIAQALDNAQWRVLEAYGYTNAIEIAEAGECSESLVRSWRIGRKTIPVQRAKTLGRNLGIPWVYIVSPEDMPGPRRRRSE